MIDTQTLLDAAKSRAAIPTDYKLAQRIGVSPNRMSGYRIGKSNPDEPTARALAELAGLDADVVVVELQAQRAQTAEARALWLRVADRLKKGAGTTLAAAIFSTFFTGNPDATALAKATAPAGAPANVSVVHSLYIVARLLKRAARWLARLGETSSSPALA